MRQHGRTIIHLLSVPDMDTVYGSLNECVCPLVAECFNEYVQHAAPLAKLHVLNHVSGLSPSAHPLLLPLQLITHNGQHSSARGKVLMIY